MLFHHRLSAQDKGRNPQINFFVESCAVFSNGDYAPFWFTSNRDGLSSIKNNHGYIRGGMHFKNKFGRNWKLKGGAEALFGLQVDQSFQYYLNLSYRFLFLYAGKYVFTQESRIHI